MTLYEKLAQRKRNGEPLVMKQVTPDMLRRLWWEDDCTDGAIADLFDVPKKKITNLRFKWGMKVPETIVESVAAHFDGHIPTDEQDSQLRTLSKEATLLLRKIRQLNDIDLDSLRVELARRFPAFHEIKNEVDFVDALERVVRQLGAKA